MSSIINRNEAKPVEPLTEPGEWWAVLADTPNCGLIGESSGYARDPTSFVAQEAQQPRPTLASPGSAAYLALLYEHHVTGVEV